MGLIEHRHAKGGLAYDDRHYPVIIMTWYGESSREAIDVSFEQSELAFQRATRDGDRLVFVSDALDGSVPPAVLRRYIAERTEAARTKERDAITLASLVAVRSAAIRGALTAIGWLSSSQQTMIPVKDMATAFERAAEILQKAGIEVPANLDIATYRRPVPWELQRSSA